MLQLEGTEARPEEPEREGRCVRMLHIYISPAWCLDSRYSDAVYQQFGSQTSPVTGLAVFASWAPGNVSLHPSYVSWLQRRAEAASPLSCLLSLHPRPMGCGNSGHFLHAATTAVVHKHSVKRISDRIWTDCKTASFKPNTVRLNCLINSRLC